MSTEQKVELPLIAIWLRQFIRHVVAEMNLEKEEMREKWADCDCGL